MQRRTFLKVTLAAAGAALFGGAGCDGDGAGTPTLVPIEAGEGWFPQSLASGDPSPSSVILWTRAVDASDPVADVSLLLEVATDADFQSPVALEGAFRLAVTAEAAADHCVKVRVTGLAAGTTYYYRFLVDAGDRLLASRTGRTRTAPAADADVPVRFAFVSCQDYNGAYYNPYRLLTGDPADLDFVLHLGDYIYETTEDPIFQEAHPGRAVAFTDEAGAIALGDPEAPYFAARTLGNYRELYRIYRSDPDLQAVHERWPMVVTWDDHEFSNDAWQDHGTYTNGREDEADAARRKAATQAWYEYMPVDYPEQAQPTSPFYTGFRIYRDLGWGKHVHLVLTDNRSHRADHLVPEDALPGAVYLTQPQLEARTGAVPELASAYVDIDGFEAGAYAAALKGAAEAEGYHPDRITGLLSVTWVNGVLGRLTDPPEPIDPAGLPRGLAFHHLGKNAPYASIGSRDLVIRDPFLLYADQRWDDTDGASEHVLGDFQETWLLDTLAASTRTWKLWGNPYMLTPLHVDLTTAATLPPSFAQKFLLSAEDWAGMPNRTDHLLTRLAAVDDVVVLTGDRHAFFAGTPHARTDKGARVPEFVVAGVSSTSYRSILIRAAGADPALQAVGAVALAASIQGLMFQEETRPNPYLAFGDVDVHGCAVVEVTAAEVQVTFHALPEKYAEERLDEPASVAISTRFRVQRGSRDLQGFVDGAWKTWDLETASWA